MVDLPAPDGEDNTNIKPRRLISVTLKIFCSLHILNLFTNLIDHRFQAQSQVNWTLADFEQRVLASRLNS